MFGILEFGLYKPKKAESNGKNGNSSENLDDMNTWGFPKIRGAFLGGSHY